jgi:hypothetical protein
MCSQRRMCDKRSRAHVSFSMKRVAGKENLHCMDSRDTSQRSGGTRCILLPFSFFCTWSDSSMRRSVSEAIKNAAKTQKALERGATTKRRDGRRGRSILSMTNLSKQPPMLGVFRCNFGTQCTCAVASHYKIEGIHTNPCSYI